MIQQTNIPNKQTGLGITEQNNVNNNNNNKMTLVFIHI